MNFRYVKVLKCIYPNIDQIFENVLIQLKLSGYEHASLETYAYYNESGVEYNYLINLRNNSVRLFSIYLHPKKNI